MNYVEPFFGSGAVLLGRPQPFSGSETVNDLDGMVCNFWRALQSAPDEVAHWADWPVNENDQHARHAWLVARKADLVARLEGDPEYYDAKIAGWWLWGICCWIGAGWCSGNGPWSVVNRQLVHLGDAGQGVNRKLVHLGSAGQGVNRKLVHLGNGGRGVHRQHEDSDGLVEWMRALAARLRGVRICCGDWSRVCGPTPTVKRGLTGVFLDPPYGTEANRTSNLYTHDSLDVAADVRRWAIENGDNPLLRVALCGYESEHDMPPSWTAVQWKAQGGYGSQGENQARDNAAREIIWFSPHCLKPSSNTQLGMFDADPEPEPVEMEVET